MVRRRPRPRPSDRIMLDAVPPGIRALQLGGDLTHAHACSESGPVPASRGTRGGRGMAKSTSRPARPRLHGRAAEAACRSVMGTTSPMDADGRDSTPSTCATGRRRTPARWRRIAVARRTLRRPATLRRREPSSYRRGASASDSVRRRQHARHVASGNAADSHDSTCRAMARWPPARSDHPPLLSRTAPIEACRRCHDRVRSVRDTIEAGSAVTTARHGPPAARTSVELDDAGPSRYGVGPMPGCEREETSAALPLSSSSASASWRSPPWYCSRGGGRRSVSVSPPSRLSC